MDSITNYFMSMDSNLELTRVIFSPLVSIFVVIEGLSFEFETHLEEDLSGALRCQLFVFEENMDFTGA